MSKFVCLILAIFGLLWAGRFEPVFAEEMVIDRFSEVSAEGVPLGWKLKVNEGKPDIAVMEEEGNKVLRLRSRKSSFRLEKKLNVDPRKCPIITWRWKVEELPQGGDVRNKKTDDQAAQIYLTFTSFPTWFRNKLTVNNLGYIWENLTPALTTQVSQKWRKIRYFVARNGEDKQKIGQWVSEKRNIIEDYEKAFGKKTPKYLCGIAIMIDSDDTASSCGSYFDDIVFQPNSDVALNEKDSPQLTP